MATKDCQDCNYVSDSEALPSNGKCSECHGTDYRVGPDVIGRPEAEQRCEACKGSGKCQTCYGKGYLRT